ncbi:MAG TPA: hypothetical protein VN428_08910 [Bryobacteraceae bacterium]|nr:hypothetical protein [Bryobacteraceae bacterium]
MRPRLDLLVQIVQRDSTTPCLQESLHVVLGVPPPGGEAGEPLAVRGGLRILPPGTRFFSAALTMRDLPLWDRVGRALRRSRWNACAVDALAGADLVFMDPDNGLAGKSASQTGKDGPKYVFPDELVPYIRRGQSLVVYHHQTREKGGLTQQIENKAAMLRGIGASRVWAFVFRRFSVRVYFLIPAPAHAALLAERSRRFIDATLWGRRGHFEMRGIGARRAAGTSPL